MTNLPPSLPPHLEDQSPTWLSKTTSARVLGNPIVWSAVTALFILLGYLWLQYYARPLSERLVETRTESELIGAQDRKEWNPDIYRDVKTLELMAITRQGDDLRAESYLTEIDHANKIQPLLKKARDLMERGLYLGNDGNNAWQAYQRILKIEPDHKIALSGAAQVLSAMQGEAEYAIEEKRYAEAEHWLMQLDSVDKEGGFQANIRQQIATQIQEDRLLEQAEQQLVEKRKMLKSALQDAAMAMQARPPAFRAAYDSYERVLELDNGNKTALNGLQAIIKQRTDIVRAAISHGEYEIAQTQIEQMQQTGASQASITALTAEMSSAIARDQQQKNANNLAEQRAAEGALLAEDVSPAEGALPAEGSLSYEDALLTEAASPNEGTLPVKSKLADEETSIAESVSPAEQSIPAESISPLKALLSGDSSAADGADRFSGPDIAERPDRPDGTLLSWEKFLNEPGIIPAGDRKTAGAKDTGPSLDGSFQSWKDFLSKPGTISAGDRKTAGAEDTGLTTNGSFESWKKFLNKPDVTPAGDRKTAEAEDTGQADITPVTAPPPVGSLDIPRAIKTPTIEPQAEVPITTIALPGTTSAPAAAASTVGVESVKIQPARSVLDVGSTASNGQTSPSVSTTDLASGIRAYYAGGYRNAFLVLRPLAEQNEARAQFRIGMMYYQGRGTAQNQDVARQWFARAMPSILLLAQNEVAWAQADLGTAYELGLSVIKDPVRAAAWYLKSARQNYAGAQANLGILYARGAGVKQDRQAALYWLKRAADQGDAAAKANLKALNAR